MVTLAFLTDGRGKAHARHRFRRQCKYCESPKVFSAKTSVTVLKNHLTKFHAKELEAAADTALGTLFAYVPQCFAFDHAHGSLYSFSVSGNAQGSWNVAPPRPRTLHHHGNHVDPPSQCRLLNLQPPSLDLALRVRRENGPCVPLFCDNSFTPLYAAALPILESETSHVASKKKRRLCPNAIRTDLATENLTEP